MARMNKKGVSELISVVLLIVLAVTLSFFVFRWISGNVSEQGEKGADRATATDLCREEIRMRVNNVQDNGDFYIVTVENLRERVLSDFLVRYELGEEILYFYREYKENDPPERYLMVSVKYLNGNGFIVTSFFTNRITGKIWKTK